jgi:hypothetical protein
VQLAKQYQGQAIESKTLGIVRFAREYHNLDLDGTMLDAWLEEPVVVFPVLVIFLAIYWMVDHHAQSKLQFRVATTF